MEAWITYSLIGMLVLGFMNYAIKMLVDGHPPLLALFLVQGLSAVFVLALILKDGVPVIETQMLKLAVPAGAFAAIALYFAFSALKMGDASKVVPIINLNTIVVVILASVLLKEHVSLKTSAGVALGILSIYLIST